MPLSYQNIEPFLNGGQNKLSQWFSYIGLTVGVLLLLSSVQLYININNLIKDKNTRKNSADFIAVTKTITNDNMGKDNRFTTADIKELKAQSFIEDAAPLIANNFKVTAGAGDLIPFSTDIFLEAINEKFIDTVPEDFIWKDGQGVVPVIFSNIFNGKYSCLLLNKL